ncbi:hypothetical protein ACFYY8_39395 [Streptosporangium sp. NPDC001559]|uniref:hypothetical protein n=1 Tax=Streptosporangium sp. NPDC001559 TaxID=3366187 RepID=UPI0036E143A4
MNGHAGLPAPFLPGPPVVRRSFAGGERVSRGASKSPRIGLTGPDLFAVLGSPVPPGPPGELSSDDQPAEVRERWPADMRRRGTGTSCDCANCGAGPSAWGDADHHPDPARRARVEAL